MTYDSLEFWEHRLFDTCGACGMKSLTAEQRTCPFCGAKKRADADTRNRTWPMDAPEVVTHG